MSCHGNRDPRRGFTLIELLVVVSIIALLISILLPSLKGAREQAKLAVCLSNMKNMGLAVHMYAQSNRDHFPLSRSHGGFQDGGWINTLAPYAGDKLLYRCPSDRSSNWFDAAHSDRVGVRENSYATNIYMTPEQPRDPYAGEDEPRFGYTRLGLVKYPMETVYIGEYRETHRNEPSADHIHAERWVPDAAGQIQDPAEQVAIGRHREKVENYTYVDGHAELRRFAETFEYDETEQRVIRNQWDPDFRRKRRALAESD